LPDPGGAQEARSMDAKKREHRLSDPRPQYVPMLASRVAAQKSVPAASCRSPAVPSKGAAACRRCAEIRRAKGKPERAQARPVHWEAIAGRRRIQALLGEARKLLQEMK